jgi:hypothetical protein
VRRKRPENFAALVTLLALGTALWGQGVAQGPPPPTTIKCKDRVVPKLEDVTEKAGIRFSHTSEFMQDYTVTYNRGENIGLISAQTSDHEDVGVYWLLSWTAKAAPRVD